MKIRPVGADGRTDRHDEAYSRLSQFCQSAQRIIIFLVNGFLLLFT